MRSIQSVEKMHCTLRSAHRILFGSMRCRISSSGAHPPRRSPALSAGGLEGALSGDLLVRTAEKSAAGGATGARHGHRWWGGWLVRGHFKVLLNEDGLTTVMTS